MVLGAISFILLAICTVFHFLNVVATYVPSIARHAFLNRSSDARLCTNTPGRLDVLDTFDPARHILQCPRVLELTSRSNLLSMASAAVEAPLAHRDGAMLEDISDAVDTVNILKGTSVADGQLFDAESRFDVEKDKTTFRQYDDACERVKGFYAEHHAKQTVAHNLGARERFYSPSRKRLEMSIWAAIEKLNTLTDDSDPDTELSQIQHLLQSAEAIRRDGKPRWMQLTGLIHDLGKVMLMLDDLSEGQWDVVGDTFPVGCCIDERCIFPDMFKANPDSAHEVYGTKHGMYVPRCGMNNLLMSWGHDEYLYLVLKDQSTLPREALAMVRFHSFYPWHQAGAYREFMADGDETLLSAVQAFNPYDLYSKSDEVLDVEELKVSMSVYLFLHAAA